MALWAAGRSAEPTVCDPGAPTHPRRYGCRRAVAADSAGGGKRLRVKASFTVWETNRTVTSDRTAKVASNANAPVIAATSAPLVGENCVTTCLRRGHAPHGLAVATLR